MSNSLKYYLKNDSWYTFRRYYVDKFFHAQIPLINKDAKVLDIGGIKNKKRGYFDISNFGLDVKYVNIDEGDEPDIVADAANIPVDDESYDVIILAEVLEHVPHASDVLQEVFRILKKGGIVLVTTPFMYHEHADPYDYYRYTSFWYQEILKKIGYSNIVIERQGGLFSVFGNTLKLWSRNKPENKSFGGKMKYKFCDSLIKKFIPRFIKLDELSVYKNQKIFKAHSTGFGVKAYKK